jgi:hypothetical protein
MIIIRNILATWKLKDVSDAIMMPSSQNQEEQLRKIVTFVILLLDRADPG